MPRETENSQQEQGARQQAPEQVKARPCPQNCAMCSMPQQVYCTAKMIFDLSKTCMQLQRQVEDLKNDIGEIRSKVASDVPLQEMSIPFTE